MDELSPLRLAEAWDNVGWIVDPNPEEEVRGVFLTIDLTQQTFDEAIAAGVNQIIAYHPPIFSALKRLRVSEPKEALIVRALAAGIGIFSPHTALDAAAGGMTDWLSEAFGTGTRTPIIPSEPGALTGAGRLVTLDTPILWEDTIERLKAHLGAPALRVSRSPRGAERIREIAFCPGAGGSLFEKVPRADLFVTGEMRHHDVLSRKNTGCHVILTEHTRSERGYLPRLAERLRQAGLEGPILVSQTDADPLDYV